MPIIADDVVIRASQRMTDFPDGGGRMSATEVVDGVDNNVFDDLTDVERLTGYLSLRKVFPSVLNADSEAYLSAHVLLDAIAADPAISAFIFTYGSVTTERADALAALAAGTAATYNTTPSGASYSAFGGTATLGSAVVTGFAGHDTGFIDASIAAGDWFVVGDTTALVVGDSATYSVGRGVLRRILSRAGADFTFNDEIPFSGLVTARLIETFPSEFSGARVYSNAGLPTGAASGATTLAVDSPLVKVAPFADGVDNLTSVAPGFDPAGVAAHHLTFGYVKAFRGGDPLLVHDTQSMAPAAVANGQTVDTLRTSLARLRVLNSDGTEHARFTSGQPDPVGVGCTANLAAGTVTFSDVSGMLQPVTIEHRIEEMVGATTIVGDVINLNRALSRAYPATARVSNLLMLGTLQGRTQLGFAQIAWSGVWSDTRSGGEPTADFNLAGYPITCTNQGSVNQRWALVFTNTTTFRIIGEDLGEIGVGTVGVNAAPLNPATGAPYFTVPATGWSAGWVAGNVYRFNTAGANAPLWVGRCVVPSLPGGDDSVTIQQRGYVNV